MFCGQKFKKKKQKLVYNCSNTVPVTIASYSQCSSYCRNVSPYPVKSNAIALSAPGIFLVSSKRRRLVTYNVSDGVCRPPCRLRRDNATAAPCTAAGIGD